MILITGATGLLGRAVYHYLSVLKEEAGDEEEVLGVGWSRAKPPLVKVMRGVCWTCFKFRSYDRNACLDITSEAELRAFLLARRPRIVIHCAAERRPDVAERDPDGTLKVLAHMLQLGRRLNLDGDTRNPLAAFDGTNQLNVESSRALASLCIEIGAWLVYLSTDYVFDGTRPPYHPGDLPNPLNFYGRSKLQGEEAVRAVNKDATILRVPILYGPVETTSECSVTSLLNGVRAHPRSVNMDHVATRYPTHVSDVARVLGALIEHYDDQDRRSAVLGKTFHFSGQQAMTKFDMAVTIAEALGLPSDHLVAETTVVPGAGAARPLNAQLSVEALSALGIDVASRDFRAAIREVLEEK